MVGEIPNESGLCLESKWSLEDFCPKVGPSPSPTAQGRNHDDLRTKPAELLNP